MPAVVETSPRGGSLPEGAVPDEDGFGSGVRPGFGWVPSVVDALVDPDRTAATLLSVASGADAVAALAVLSPVQLSQAGRLDALAAVDRQLAWLTARQQELIAAVADDAAAAARQRELARAALSGGGAAAVRRPDRGRVRG